MEPRPWVSQGDWPFVLIALFGGLVFWPICTLIFRKRRRKLKLLRNVFVFQLVGYVLITLLMVLGKSIGMNDAGDLLFLAFPIGVLSIMASIFIIAFIWRDKQ